MARDPGAPDPAANWRVAYTRPTQATSEKTRDSPPDTDEPVIAIQVNDVARASPIRGNSYHHIVNDVVGGVPIVAWTAVSIAAEDWLAPAIT